MTAAGWAKGSDGVWAKGGQRASFTVNTTAGNQRRVLTEEFLQQEFKVAGFEMKIDNSGDLFDTHVNADGELPGRDLRPAAHGHHARSVRRCARRRSPRRPITTAAATTSG